MRVLKRWSVVFTLAWLASCGGGSDTPSAPKPSPTPVPDPTPVVGPPASITVQAGDAQSAEPGAAVPIAPSVIVRDANARAVANVSVTFAVDSGGGVVGSSSATTGADGVASAGSWKMGPLESSQVLIASVANVTPVRIRATARVAPTVLAPQSVPAAGGTLTFVRPGLALDGMSIALGPNAYSAPTTISVAIASTVGIALPSGMKATAPAITIQTSGATRQSSLVLSLPLTSAQDSLTFAIARDPISGSFAALPVLSRSATRLVVSLPITSALQFGATASASGGTASSTTFGAWLRPPTSVARGLSTIDAFGVVETDPVVLTVAVDPRVIEGDFDSGFRAGVDDWNMLALPSYGLPTIQPYCANVAFCTVNRTSAPALSAVWYYNTRQKLDGHLFGRFTKTGALPLSNQMGHRWTAELETKTVEAWSADATTETQKSGDPRSPSSGVTSFFGLKMLFLLSRNRPQLVVLHFADINDVRNDFTLAVAYRTVGNAVDFTNPFNPGDAVRMLVIGGQWQPTTIRTSGGATHVVDALAPVPTGSPVDPWLAQTYPSVSAGTFDNDRWPRAKLMSRFGELDPNDVVLVDTLEHWWECPTCDPTTYRPINPVGIVGNIIPFAFLIPGSSQNQVSIFSSLKIGVAVLTDPNFTQSAEMVQFQPGIDANSGTFDASIAAWLDWRTINYRRLVTTITPSASLLLTADTTVTFSVATVNPPANVSYRWKLRAQTIDSTDTSAPTYTRALPSGTRGYLIVTVLQGPGKRPIGRDSVAISGPPVWRLATFTPTAQNAIDAEMAAVAAKPTDWVLFVFPKTVASIPSNPFPTPGVYLQERPGTTTAGLTFLTSGARTIPLAHRVVLPPSLVTGFFTWVGDASSGTVDGNGTPLLLTCTQPLGSIQATKSGATMTGVLGRRITKEAICDGGALDVSYRGNFTATLLPPL